MSKHLPILSLLALLASGLPAAGGPLTPPEWSRGDTWTLKATYRPLVLGKAARREAEKRGEPRAGSLLDDARAQTTTYWTYQVVRVDERPDGGRSYIVQVKDRAGEKDAAASLLFLARPVDGVAVMGLMEGKFLTVQTGRPILNHLRLNEPGGSPRPVLPDASVIPHAFPAFPVTTGEAQVFPDTRGEGEFQFAMDSVQRVTADVDAASIRGRPGLASLLKEAGYPDRGLTHVELTRGLDGLWARQLWTADQPWPVYGENPSCRWHMIYSSYRHARDLRRAVRPSDRPGGTP